MCPERQYNDLLRQRQPYTGSESCTWHQWYRHNLYFSVCPVTTACSGSHRIFASVALIAMLEVVIAARTATLVSVHRS